MSRPYLAQHFLSACHVRSPENVKAVSSTRRTGLPVYECGAETAQQRTISPTTHLQCLARLSIAYGGHAVPPAFLKLSCTTATYCAFLSKPKSVRSIQHTSTLCISIVSCYLILFYIKVFSSPTVTYFLRARTSRESFSFNSSTSSSISWSYFQNVSSAYLHGQQHHFWTSHLCSGSPPGK